MDLGLRQKLREVIPDYSENTLHSGGRKGRGTKDGVHVDAYIPWESALGTKLRLKVEKLTKHTESAPMGQAPGSGVAQCPSIVMVRR